METKQKREALALRKLREIKRLTRKEAGILVGLSHKSVEKIENGRTIITKEKIHRYINAYGFIWEEFVDCYESKLARLVAKHTPPKPKIIEHNHLRRFAKKIITKEAQTLRVLRRLAGLTQEQASQRCGYYSKAIGFIENGRLELRMKRIEHIVTSYGFTMKDFEYHKNSDQFVTDIQDDCIKIIQDLGEDKLKAVYPLLKTFTTNRS